MGKGSNIKFKIRGFVKKFNFISDFYWKFCYCPAALQIDLSKLQSQPELSGFKMCTLSLSSPMFEDYVQFINTSYEEKIYTKEQLADLLKNHHYLKNVETYVLLNKEEEIVGTISTGVYKEDEQWGGVFKFATKKSQRKQGLGLYMLQYGYNTLKERGCLYGESIVSDRPSRIASLMTHFKCGFVPQTDRNKVQFSACRGEHNKLKGKMTNKWVMKYYNIYLSKHGSK